MASAEPPARQGLLIDYGGVLTSDLFAAFGAFCTAEGLERDAVMDAFRSDPSARELLIELECGQVAEQVFEERLAALLGVSAAGLIDRMFAGSTADEPMRATVRAARAAGIRTGLVSNSWTERHYESELIDELFDAVVISGREGIRKPAPEMYRLGAQRIGLDPERCVYVDDLPFNLTPAAEMGMATIHHVDAGTTIEQLEALLDVPLR